MLEKTFNTAEKFLMIAHHPEKGRFMISGMFIQFGIAGAILLDMSLEERIDILNKRLILKTPGTSADPLTNEVTTLISRDPRPRRVGYWVRRLARRYNKYKRQVLESLAAKRMVRIEERKFLGLIPYRRSYLIESYTRSNLIRQIKNDILVNSREPSYANMAIAGLMEACRMQRILSDDREELKNIRIRLKKILKESPVADVVSQTVRQVQAAIFASVTAAIVASRAGGHQ
jgi:golgi phosphoprotein 3